MSTIREPLPDRKLETCFVSVKHICRVLEINKFLIVSKLRVSNVCSVSKEKPFHKLKHFSNSFQTLFSIIRYYIRTSVYSIYCRAAQWLLGVDLKPLFVQFLIMSFVFVLCVSLAKTRMTALFF